MSCILVVEDDRAVRDVVSDMLIDAGYAVARAGDGADALDQARAHPPDAILLDLMMPVMDGWKFLEAMHEDSALGGIPVALMSAIPALRQAARAQGVRITVGKPFAAKELLDQVERLLAPSDHRPARLT